ncbi:MAG TPA: DUF2892 domain-containing protein [Candidatus Kryptobacter bacterium]|nr:DUF2892 domain-containing protein [Candidatus Kryptobacter bacterium]
MKKNVGNADKWIRIVVGLVLISLVFIGPKTAWGWIGLVLIGTALINFCPIWAALKISTRKEEKKTV